MPQKDTQFILQCSFIQNIDMQVFASSINIPSKQGEKKMLQKKHQTYELKTAKLICTG